MLNLILSQQVIVTVSAIRIKTKSGGYSEKVTPVPIPNTVVKLLSADGTWWETAWESRTPPVLTLIYLENTFQGSSMVEQPAVNR